MRPPLINDRDLAILQIMSEQRRGLAEKWRPQYDRKFLVQKGPELGQLALFYWSCLIVFQDNPKKSSIALLGALVLVLEWIVKAVAHLV